MRERDDSILGASICFNLGIVVLRSHTVQIEQQQGYHRFSSCAKVVMSEMPEEGLLAPSSPFLL